jgi:predicted TIM-barrel fold metal-dependent hydrolase
LNAPLQIVDPHIHLWDLKTGLYPRLERPSKDRNGSNAAIARSYLLEEFLDEGNGEVEIVGAVHVEAFPTDPVAESAALQKVADTSPVPLALVAGGDPAASDFVALLDRHAAYPIFRGIRQVVNRHRDAAYNYVDREFLSEPAFLEGLKVLGRRNLSFDLQLYPHQMKQAAGIAARASNTQFVLNHAGMWADRDLAGWQEYKAGLRILAAEPNVAVKISGLVMMDPRWTIESIRPLVLETLEAFGPARSMFASNFPVDKRHSDYPTIWRAFATVAASFSQAEQKALFRDNASSIYRVH